MAWNDNATPAGWITVTSGRHAHLFAEGDALTFTLSAATAVSYEVRDYFGEIAASGAVSGTSLTLPALALGWYRLYLHQSGSDAVYGTLIGVCSFSVLTTDARLLSPQASGVTAGAAPEFKNTDHILRGLSLLGPHRYWITDAADPTGGGATDANIAAQQADLVYYQQYYEANPDPARPRPAFLQFPNGGVATGAHTAGVTATVAALYPDIEYFEGPSNEPQGTAAATVATQMQTFYNAVKAGHASAKVLGPNPVTFNGDKIAWLDAFLTAGGGNYVDALSLHAYNCVNGDITLGRRSMDALMVVLTEHGLEDIELWQTECGTFAADFGVLNPRSQARWAMMQRFVFDQYGIPKERDYWFYDTSHGFWSFSSFYKTSGGSVMPMIPLYRVYSQEVFGKTWQAALDFGTVENDFYIGSRFEDEDGDAVLAILSGGRTDGAVQLAVAGAVSVEVVGPFGDVTTVSCDAQGLASVDVANEPVYVRLPVGVTATVEAIDYGHNVARWGATATAGSGTADEQARIVNGTLENWYYQAANAPTEYRDTTALPATVTVTLDNPRRCDTVVIHCPTPWQESGALLDYDLEYQDEAEDWHTVETVTEPTLTFSAPAPAAGGRCFYDTYHSGRCVFVHEFDPVTAVAFRLTVRDATSGGIATAAAAAAGGQSGARKIRLREIAVYSRDSQTQRVVLVNP